MLDSWITIPLLTISDVLQMIRVAHGPERDMESLALLVARLRNGAQELSGEVEGVLVER